MANLVEMDALARSIGIVDHDDDLWLAGVLSAVTDAIEIETGHWFVSRGAATSYFDAPDDEDEMHVPQGISTVTYLGVAQTDQPDTGLGAYSQITSGIYLDPPVQDRRNGEPATWITLGSSAPFRFPTGEIKRAVKITATWGWTAVPPRVAQIATAAITRAFRARTSGGADYAIVGPDGGMKILRDFAPAELEELRRAYSELKVG
jgi:hypothetical protein